MSAAIFKDKCIHFRGIQNVCAAGVDPRTVRDASGPGVARWPCLTLIGKEPATTVCPHRRPMTPEDHAEQERRIMAAVEKFERDIKDGICPHCGNPMLERRVVGRCEYAEPCGHRLGQLKGDDNADE